MNRSAAVGMLVAEATAGGDLPGTASIYWVHRSRSISACIYIFGPVGRFAFYRVVIRPGPTVKGSDH